MTDQKQEEPKKIETPKPISQALILGGAGGLVTLAGGLFLDVSGDTSFKMATVVFLTGSAVSLGISWSDGRLKTKPRQRKKRENVGIPFTSAKGKKYIDMSSDMEFSIEQGGYVLKETYGQAVWRKLKGRERKVVKRVEQVKKPEELDEFVFYSQDLQLRQVHISLFLKSAWRNRQFGKGLSARRWVRRWSQRQAWYKETLGPIWYFAAIDLLERASSYTGYHLIVKHDNGWKSLVNEPHLTMRILKWYEVERRKR